MVREIEAGKRNLRKIGLAAPRAGLERNGVARRPAGKRCDLGDPRSASRFLLMRDYAAFEVAHDGIQRGAVEWVELGACAQRSRANFSIGRLCYLHFGFAAHLSKNGHMDWA